MNEELNGPSPGERPPSSEVTLGDRVVQRDSGKEYEVVTFNPGVGGNELVKLERLNPDGSLESSISIRRAKLENDLIQPGSPWSRAEADPAGVENNHDDIATTGESLGPEEQLARNKAKDYFVNALRNHDASYERRKNKGKMTPELEKDFAETKARLEAYVEAINNGNLSGPVEIPEAGGQPARTSGSVYSFFERRYQWKERELQNAPYSNYSESQLERKQREFDEAKSIFDALQEAKAPAASSTNAEGGDEKITPPGTEENSNDQPPGNGTENKEDYEPEDPWLDPRLITQLRKKYLAKLAKQAAIAERLDDKVSEHFKTILKTSIIEEAVGDVTKGSSGDRANRVKWLAGQGNLGNERRSGFEPTNQGDITAPPSEEVKQRMAVMMDDKNLNEEVAKADYHRFRVGQEVKYAHAGGKIKTGWKVESFYDVQPTGEVYVTITNKDGERRWPEQESLLRMQTLSENINDEAGQFKKYFNQPVKVRLESGELVEGRFAGVSLNGGIYVDVETDEFITNSQGEVLRDAGGRPRHKVNKLLVKNTQGFEEWQHERTTSEIEAERTQAKAERTAELEAKLEAYMNQTVKVRDAEGNWMSDFKCVDYIEDAEGRKFVKTLRREEDEDKPHYFLLEDFINWQEEAVAEEEAAREREEEEERRRAEEGGEDDTEELDVTEEDLESPKGRAKRVLAALSKYGGRDIKILRMVVGEPIRVMFGDKTVEFPFKVVKGIKNKFTGASVGAGNTLVNLWNADFVPGVGTWPEDKPDEQLSDAERKKREEIRAELQKRKFRRRARVIIAAGAIIAADVLASKPYGPRLPF